MNGCRPSESRSVSSADQPTSRVERAQGVSDVEVDGSVLRCLVSGSFQPLLDAVHGYEVVDLNAVSVENEWSAAPRRISP